MRTTILVLLPTALFGVALWASVRTAHRADSGQNSDVRLAASGSRRHQASRIIQSVALTGGVSAALVMMTRTEPTSVRVLAMYGAMVTSYLLLKLLAASWYQPYRDEVPAGLSIAAVIPTYNEDPTTFRQCLASLLRQTRPLDEIYVVDDGSASSECVDIANEMLEGVAGAVVHRLPTNRGRRHAQAWAFSRTDCDVVVTVASDTVLDGNAIREGLRPFANDDVQGVAANARPLNRSANFLTLLIDLRFMAAFEHERAAYDSLNTALCSTSVMAFWRTPLIRRNLSDYTDQTFLGTDVSYGDDRRLASYAAAEGRVAWQGTSKCATVVPDNMNGFVRQQLRWNKSFFRETAWALRNLPPSRSAWTLSVAELCLWAPFSFAAIATLTVSPETAGKIVGVYYLGLMVLTILTRNVRSLSTNKSMYGFMLAPMYALLHVAVLTPLRFYSLLQLRDGAWGTRESLFSGVSTPAPTSQPLHEDLPVT